MGIPNRQIGWSQESNLLWQISKQLDQTSCQLCNISGTSGITSATASGDIPAIPGLIVTVNQVG